MVVDGNQFAPNHTAIRRVNPESTSRQEVVPVLRLNEACTVYWNFSIADHPGTTAADSLFSELNETHSVTVAGMQEGQDKGGFVERSDDVTNIETSILFCNSP